MSVRNEDKNRSVDCGDRWALRYLGIDGRWHCIHDIKRAKWSRDVVDHCETIGSFDTREEADAALDGWVSAYLANKGRQEVSG